MNKNKEMNKNILRFTIGLPCATMGLFGMIIFVGKNPHLYFSYLIIHMIGLVLIVLAMDGWMTRWEE